MKEHELQGSTILIIDDNPTNLEILSNYLRRLGYTVLVEENGVNALESLKKNRPDIILLDIVMPEIDGFETCRRLKNNNATQDIPVIFMSALSEMEDKLKGFKLGAVDYITKPFQREEVLERVNTHLTIKNLQKELQQKNSELQDALERERRLMSDLRLSLSLALPHELRTPLTVILGFSSFLTKFEKLPKPEHIVQYGNSIYKSSLRLYRLIENALIYANLKLLNYTTEKGILAQPDTTGNIERRIRSIAQSKALEAERKQDLILQVENAVVQVNPTHFEKILTELLENAFKNSEPGTPVALKASVQNDLWTFSISDRGRGMSEEQISNVDAFIQFDRMKHEQQGLGFGLTIAQLLTKLEGGSLSIESQLHQGTTIRLVFHCADSPSSSSLGQEDPWLEMPLPERPMFRDRDASCEREIQGYIASHHAAVYKLLSIDHDWMNGEALGQLLGPLGFKLIEAFDEFDGVDKIMNDSPDIIFWDVSRAEGKAIELVREIRRSVTERPAKIVAITTKTSDDVSLRKLTGYCDAIWQKPVSAQTIFEQLPQLLPLQWSYK